MTTPQSSTAYNEDPRHIQDIVFYFSSRLRAASIATVNSTQVKKEWMQKYLALDLVINYIYCYLQLMFTIASEVGFIVYWFGRGNWPFLQHSVHYQNTLLESLYIRGRGIGINRPRLTSPS